jgi:chromosome segregation ATPase
MNKKMALVLLIAVVLVGTLGCRKSGTETKKQAAAPAAPPTTVGGQQPATGTAQQPPATQPPAAVGEANQAASARSAQEGKGVTPARADVSTQAFIKGTDQSLNSLQQKMSELQPQISSLKPEAQQKAQQLQKQFQQDLTSTRAALDKMKTASGESLVESRAAAEKGMGDATATLKELQSYLESQTPGAKK